MEKSSKKYSKMVDEKSKKSPMIKNMIFAFIIGGIICTLGQILYNIYINTGFSLQDSRTLVSISLVFLSALFTALHLYDKVAKVAGAGTLVPITGFANSVVSPAMEFKSEGFITGLGAKMFIIAGPVLVYGITASTLYGIVVWIFNLY